MDLRETSIVATSVYPTTSQLFPLPPHVPSSHGFQQFRLNSLLLWGEATVLVVVTTHLLTDGFPSMVLTALRLVRSERTPLLHQTLLREGRR